MRPTPSQLRSLARRDPRLGRALRLVPPLPDFPAEGAGRRRSRYEALARAIVFQQLSGKAAGTIWGRACALTPGPRFPTPPELDRLSDGDLRGAGLSGAKQRALRDLAARVADGRLRPRALGHLEDEEVIEELVTVRGIGRWTAQMFLLFQLGRLDVMAPDDLGLQEGLRRLDGLDERPGPRELAARAEVWAPLRSVASWTLWRLVDLEEVVV